MDAIAISAKARGLMRGPSARVLANYPGANVCIYSAIEGIDADRAPQYTYSSTPTYANEPCSIQHRGSAEDPNSQQRVTQVNIWWFMFTRPLNIKPRDKITWNDEAGKPRTAYAQEDRKSEAGRGGQFVTHAIERL